MTADRDARYEFRCWPASARAQRDGLGPDWLEKAVDIRTDVYFLPPDRPDFLPKLRGGARFQIKERLKTEAPLEFWRLSFDETLPVAPERLDFIRRVFDEPALTELAFASEAAATEALRGAAQIVPVRKNIVTFERDGCVLSFTEGVAEGENFESVGLECASPEPVLRAIGELGLEGLDNMDFGAALLPRLAPPAGARSEPR